MHKYLQNTYVYVFYVLLSKQVRMYILHTYIHISVEILVRETRIYVPTNSDQVTTIP